jgi:hypothetical protein
MVQAYNFLAAWQLFPEKGNYECGERPKSGIYKIESPEGKKELIIYHNWVTLELADNVRVNFIDSISFEIHFYKKGEANLHIVHEIMPNGYLKIIQQGINENGSNYTNTEYYHKQLSVLPYSASVAGAVIKANEEGMIKHKALTAMEEQTNMQLLQIRKQIELLALQAQEIHKRKELSLMIYTAKLSFKPNIGQVYFLYEKNDGSHMLSLIAPGEWGNAGPFKKFVASVKLLADHTWMEL